MGTTGIETVEIIKGIVDNVKPKLIIVIDSLASRSIERISNTVQIADTGITPGAGVGNTREGLNKESLGVPVLAIGVPMVVDAATIVSDSLDLFIVKEKERLEEEKEKDNSIGDNELNKIHEIIQKSGETDKYSILKKVLSQEEMNFIVTPKEIDDLIKNMSNAIAKGINLSI